MADISPPGTRAVWWDGGIPPSLRPPVVPTLTTKEEKQAVLRAFCHGKHGVRPASETGHNGGVGFSPPYASSEASLKGPWPWATGRPYFGKGRAG